MMALSGISVYHVIKNTGESLVYASQWCNLQAFAQAVMWHNTEPSTLGVSYWSSILFVVTLCVPGILYSVREAVFPANCFSLHRGSLALQIVFFVLRTLPAITLATATLPYLDENAAIRTFILSCGVVSISYYVILLAWRHNRNQRCDVSSHDDTHSTSTSLCNVTHKWEKIFICKRFVSYSHDKSIGSQAIIGMLEAMGIRWYFNSLNIFNEDWRASFLLMAFIFIYGFIIAIVECSQDKAFFCAVRVKNDAGEDAENSKKETLGYHEPVKLTPEKSSRYDLAEEIQDIHSYLSHEENSNDIQLRNQFLEDHQIEVFHKTNKVDLGSLQSCHKTIFMLALVYSIILAAGVAALTALSIWIFSSPAVLCRWGEIPLYPLGTLLFISFGIGCLIAIFLNGEKACKASEARWRDHASMTEKAKHPIFTQLLVNTFLCCAMVFGTSFILYTKKAVFLFGACLLSIVVPVVIRVTLLTIHDFVSACKSLKSVAKCMGIIPGLLICLSGLFFVILHVMTIMFINPQISALVLGRIDCITWAEIVAGILPLVFAPLLHDRFKQSRSSARFSANGPLLPQKSPRCERGNTTEHRTVAANRRYFQTGGVHNELRFIKVIQALVTLSILAVILLAKYSSKHTKLTCDMESNTKSFCDDRAGAARFDIRVLSWNILLGHKMNGRSNLDSISRFLNDHNPHVAAFQEADALPMYWGGRDVFGYLRHSFKPCSEVAKGVNPMKSTLGVGILSQLNIVEEWNSFLPRKQGAKIPNYSVTRIKCELRRGCDPETDVGSGDLEGLDSNNEKTYLHVYSLHAVYKNWTCPHYSNLSKEQMKFVHDDIAALPRDSPVIVMGDFNINPSERELDIWFQSDQGFKSALRYNRDELILNTDHYNVTSEADDSANNTCDCKCQKSSSDPPFTTLVNRRAAVDHIFFRGLTLVEARVATEVGNISDHYPIVADFRLQPYPVNLNYST